MSQGMNTQLTNNHLTNGTNGHCQSSTFDQLMDDTTYVSSSFTFEEVTRLIEREELTPSLENLVDNLLPQQSFEDVSESSSSGMMSLFTQPLQDLKSIYNHLIASFITGQSKWDQDQVEKCIAFGKDKINTVGGHATYVQATGNSIGDEIDIHNIEVLNYKYVEYSDNPQVRAKIISLLQALFHQDLVSRQVLLTHLDEQLLFAASIIDSKTYQQRKVKAITQSLYEQQKFNLLREENEGFAKLIVELNQPNINMTNIDTVKKNVNQLIGFFSLDPNRVLDITLDSFANQVDNIDPYISLLSDYKGEYVAQQLGFKFQAAQEQLTQALKISPRDLYQLENKIPKKLCLITAILISRKIINLWDIWPHLSIFQETAEDIDEVEQLLKRQSKLVKYQYQSLFINVTNKESYEKELKKEVVEQDEIILLRNDMYYNLRLWLIESFVRINQWDIVEDILSGVYENRLDLTFHRPTLQAMYEALDWFINPLYNQLVVKNNPFMQFYSKKSESKPYLFTDEKGYNQGRIRQAVNSKILFEDLPKILKCLSINLAFDQILFQKLTIVVEGCQKDNIEFAKKIAGEVFFPALALVESTNDQIAKHIWGILSQVDYVTRYSYYRQMLTESYLQNISLIQSLISTQQQIYKWQRRLSIDNVKQCTRQLTKLASSNPLIVFNTMMKQAKQYDNQIEAINLSLQSCNPLSLDVCAYTILRFISDAKDEPLDEEENPHQWLKNFAQFAAMFFKKYHQVDMIGLFTYLLNKMRKDNDHNQMIILKEVVASMFGWSMFNIDEMTQQQLQSLSGGFALRLELMSQTSQFKKRNKTSLSLLKLFWEKTNEKPLSLAVQLMANLAKVTQHVLHHTDTQAMDRVSKLYDRIHFTFLQFTETLQHLSYLEIQQGNLQFDYQQLLPPQVERVLTVNYNLPPAYTMFIIRGGLKPIFQLNEEEFNQKVHMFKSILDMHLDQRSTAVTDEKSEMNEYFNEKLFIKSRKEEVWQVLNPKLYTIFWYLNLQNLIVPEDAYTDQIKKLQKQLDELKPSTNQGGQNQRTYDKLKKNLDNLYEEKKNSKSDAEKVQEFLKHKLKECFEQYTDDNLINLSAVFIQYCFYPRLMFSTSDSLFSFHFLLTLHQHRVPNFNILHTLAQFLKSIVPSIHCCTTVESDNIGIFFQEVFNQINYWSRPEIWEQECEGYSGFSKMVGNNQPIKVNEFQQIGESIQKRFTQNLVECFKNPIQGSIKTKCALKILNRLLSQYLTIFKVGQFLQKHLQELVDGDLKNKDNKLYALALACKNNLDKKIQTMSKGQANAQPNSSSAVPSESSANQAAAQSQSATSSSRIVEISGSSLQSASGHQDGHHQGQSTNSKDAQQMSRPDSNREPRETRDGSSSTAGIQVSTTGSNTQGESKRKIKEREKEEIKQGSSNFSSQPSQTPISAQTQGAGTTRTVIASQANSGAGGSSSSGRQQHSHQNDQMQQQQMTQGNISNQSMNESGSGRDRGGDSHRERGELRSEVMGSTSKASARRDREQYDKGSIPNTKSPPHGSGGGGGSSVSGFKRPRENRDGGRDRSPNPKDQMDNLQPPSKRHEQDYDRDRKGGGGGGSGGGGYSGSSSSNRQIQSRGGGGGGQSQGGGGNNYNRK